MGRSLLLRREGLKLAGLEDLRKADWIPAFAGVTGPALAGATVCKRGWQELRPVISVHGPCFC